MASSGASGANASPANSVDEWREDYTYQEVKEYFGIEDRNPKVKPIKGKTLNVFSTNLFIPMELEISDKLFAGREFDPKALQLTKISSISKFKLNEKTSTYSNLTKQNLPPTDRIISIPLSIKSEIKYIVKQLNSSPIRLFFVNKETYEREKDNPLYSFTTIYFDSQYGFSITEQNKKEIPEIDIFLEEYSNV